MKKQIETKIILTTIVLNNFDPIYIRKLCGTEIFSKLKTKRDFKNNKIIFDKDRLCVEITFESDDLELFKDIIFCYGYMDDEDMYGSNYDLFLNDKIKLDKNEFNINLLKKKDKITIFYNNSSCFELYFHILIHEIDDKHDDNYFLRKELEKWSIS